MSDNFLKLIPCSARYVPDENAAARGKAFLADRFSEASSVAWELTEQVQFIAPGQNFERVACPVCNQAIALDWWQNAMDMAYRTGFVDLSARLPCCNTLTSLNDLIYERPAGFARFVLEIASPGGDIDDRDLAELESIVGCPLRKVWAHY